MLWSESSPHGWPPKEWCDPEEHKRWNKPTENRPNSAVSLRAGQSWASIKSAGFLQIREKTGKIWPSLSFSSQPARCYCRCEPALLGIAGIPRTVNAASRTASTFGIPSEKSGNQRGSTPGAAPHQNWHRGSSSTEISCSTKTEIHRQLLD